MANHSLRSSRTCSKTFRYGKESNPGSLNIVLDRIECIGYKYKYKYDGTHLPMVNNFILYIGTNHTSYHVEHFIYFYIR